MNRNEKVDLLTYLIENDRIDVVRVQEEMERKNKLELLSMHPFEVWQGKDGMWKTYLPDEKKGRVFGKEKQRKKYNRLSLIIGSRKLKIRQWKNCIINGLLRS